MGIGGISGLGSGIDTSQWVAKLIAVEREPVARQLMNKQAALGSQFSAYESLKSSLSSFQNTLTNLSKKENFISVTATSSDSTLFTATASSTNSVGQYVIKTQSLAASHKLQSQNYPNSDHIVGTGVLTISVGDKSFNVTIDTNNSSLSGIADAINTANNNTGVLATIVNVDGGSRLILTSAKTGTESALQISAVDNDSNNSDITGLSALTYIAGVTENMTLMQEPANAIITIDEQTVTSQSNTFIDAILGVNITLLKAPLDGEATLTVGLNTNNITEQVNGFVNAYNQFVKQSSALTFYNVDKKEKGPLLGDPMLRTLQTQLRRVMTQSFSIPGSTITHLASLGITTNRDGTLSLDKNRLNSAVSNSAMGVQAFFTDDSEGLANTLLQTVSSYTRFNGIIDSQNQTLQRQIGNVITDAQALDDKMNKLQKRLEKQFAEMDRIVKNLRGTSDFLTQQLDKLPTIGGK